MPLTIETRRVDELVLDPTNARKHPARNIETIRASLRHFGQRKPIVIDRHNVVVAGNGTLEAIRAEGWLDVDVTVFPGDANEARAFALTDNRSAELAEWDDGTLADVLRMVDEAMRDELGWTPDELEELLRDYPGDSAGYDAAEPGSGNVFTDEQIIDAAFEHFRRAGFPYPDVPRYLAMQQINRLQASETDVLANTLTAYHVPDPYQSHRFETKAGQKATPIQAFGRDDRLCRALRLALDDEGTITPASLLSMLSLVSGTQLAAQFRPGYALLMYRRFAPNGGTVLDTSTGFGGRLVGFFASHCAKYIGIDPSRRTHDGNSRMIADLCPAGKAAQLHCMPAEDVPHELIADSCDFAFTSPPYFAKERYAPDEETQSHARYPEAEQWRDGFLRPMLALQYAALKPGAYSVVNIAPVAIGSSEYPLDDWTIAAAIDGGFEHVDTELMPLSRVPGRGEQAAQGEPLLIFRRQNL